MDFDDFYRFVLTNHDLGMVRKSILTLSIQKKQLTHFSNFTPTLTLSRSQTFTAGLDLTCSLFFWLNSDDFPFFTSPLAPLEAEICPIEVWYGI